MSNASWGLHRLYSTGVDIDQPGMAASVAQLRGQRGEVILFTSNAQMTGWTYNWVSQLRQRGHENWLLLADGERTCSILQQGWMPMVLQHGEAPLPCIWSSYPGSHPGWSQWGKLQGNDDLYRVYMFWSTRWWVRVVKRDCSLDVVF